MISPFRLPLTFLFAGASVLSLFAATDTTKPENGTETTPPEYMPSKQDPESGKQWQWIPGSEKAGSNGLNIAPAWEKATGKGVTIGLIGPWIKANLEEENDAEGNPIKVEVTTHEDLKVNTDLAFKFLGYDLNKTADGKYKNEDVEGALAFTGDEDGVDATVGTALAGLAAATGWDDKGVIGAAPEAEVTGLYVGLPDEEFDPLDTENEEWAGYLDYVYEELSRAFKVIKDNSIRVANLGIDICDGTNKFPHYFRTEENLTNASAYRNALNGMINNKTVYVVAAGNTRGNDSNNSEDEDYNNLTPADTNGNILTNYEGAIVVGATNSAGVYDTSSNYGANLFVVAPGANTYTTNAAGEYGNFSGSSTLAASAIVSGVIALAAEKNPAMDARWAKHAIVKSAVITDAMRGNSAWVKNGAGVEFSRDYGFGMINPVGFVEAVENIAYQTSRKTYVPTATLTMPSAWRNGGKANALLEIKAEDKDKGLLDLPIESVEVSVKIEPKLANYFEDFKIELVFDPSGVKGDGDAMRSVLMDSAGLSSTKLDDATLPFEWTFVSNAFWGMKIDSEGEWNVVLTNKNKTSSATVESVSVKFNTGSVAYEKPGMTLSGEKPDSEGWRTLEVDAMVLDKETTTLTIGEAERLKVKDVFIINNGTVTVGNGGEVIAAGDVKPILRLVGGTLNLNEDGNIEIPVEIKGGTLNLRGGSIEGSVLNIDAGVVNIYKAGLNAETYINQVNLRGGELHSSADGWLDVGVFNMSGGLFEMNGGLIVAGGELSAIGGRLNVATGSLAIVEGGVTVGSGKVKDATGEETVIASSLVVAKGGTLQVGKTLNLKGWKAEGAENPVYAVMTVDGSVSAEKVAGKLASVVLNGGANIGCAMALDASELLLTYEDPAPAALPTAPAPIAVSGGISLTDSRCVIKAGTILKASLNLSDTDFTVAGTGVDITYIDSLNCKDSDIRLAIGERLEVAGDAKFEGGSLFLTFEEKFPEDKVAFIKTGGNLVVDEDLARAATDTEIRYWDGDKIKEVGLEYELNKDGDFEAYFPEREMALSPLRIIPKEATPVQRAVLDSLFTCVDEGPNAGVSKELLETLNSFEYQTPFLNALDQFRPYGLITINSLNNKQANAVTGALERRSRELRTGYPVADFWSQPLFNSYGFSFATKPNTAHSNGMRQFMGYDLSDQRAMLWANGGYSFSDGDATAHTSKNETDMINASIGFDYALTNNWAVGIFASYSGGMTEATESETEAAMRSVGLYLSGVKNTNTGSAYCIGMVSYGLGEYDFTRSTSIENTTDAGQYHSYSSKASASPDGSQAIGYIAAGWEWEAGSQALSYQWTTGPMASLRYTYNSIDGYTEDGNGADALEVDDFSYDSLLASLGWRATVRFDIAETVTFVPEARFSWQHEFLDGDETIDAALAIPGAVPFSTTMNKEGADYVTAGVGVTVLIAEETTIALDYDVNFLREDSDPEHNINLMVRCRF